ncbi:MAG: hypothetical protein ACYTHJ_02085 [Planctomycetota bacterium]|jgi:hypothetical protein
MIEKVCNLWLESAEYRCIPTTGAVENGEAVMNNQIAREAAFKYASIPADLGRLITSRGNHVHLIRPGIVSFPIKQYAWQGVTIPILQRSAQELMQLVGDAKTLLPRPPLGESDPSWEEVAVAFASLPDSIIVIQHQ